jgi:hypothetical protein
MISSGAGEWVIIQAALGVCQDVASSAAGRLAPRFASKLPTIFFLLANENHVASSARPN